MSEKKDSSKLGLGLILGLAVGALGMLFGQVAMKGPAAEADGPDGTAAGDDLAALRAESDRLAAENAKLKEDLNRALASTAGTDAPVAKVTEEEAVDQPAEKKNGFVEALLAMGADKADKDAAKDLAKLAERLDLTAAQQEEVQALLAERKKEQQAAGMKMMVGGVDSLDQLLAADEDNYASVDAAMEDILSDSQLEEYGVYAQEREVARIERKSDEELKGLAGVGDLTQEQSDQAWQVFADIVADEKPGDVPEGSTLDDFGPWIDEAIDKRITGLTPILDDQQMTAYRGQTETFRTFMNAIVQGGK